MKYKKTYSQFKNKCKRDKTRIARYGGVVMRGNDKIKDFKERRVI